MKYKYENLTVNYDCQGQGPPIILLHGWGTNYHTFDYLIHFLKRKYTIFTMDLPRLWSK